MRGEDDPESLRAPGRAVCPRCFLVLRPERSRKVTVAELLKTRRDQILRIAAKHGARNVRVFGSVARGDTGPASDIDFLVELEEGRSLLDHVALCQDLEELLGCKVDVVTEKALHWYIRDRALTQAIPL
jgi:hypothetical protein